MDGDVFCSYLFRKAAKTKMAADRGAEVQLLPQGCFYRFQSQGYSARQSEALVARLKTHVLLVHMEV